MKAIVLCIVALVSTACSAGSSSYEITVKGSEFFPKDSEISIWRRTLAETPTGAEYLKKASFSSGDFSLSGTVDTPHLVNLNISPAGKGPHYFVLTFVLEAGKTEIEFTSRENFY